MKLCVGNDERVQEEEGAGLLSRLALARAAPNAESVIKVSYPAVISDCR